MNKHYHHMLQSINRFLKLKPGLVTAETNLKEELGLTEWELILLINQLERNYQVEIPDKELKHMHTVEAIIQRIKE